MFPYLNWPTRKGAVLLIADAHVDVPATAEILDARDSLLASHFAF
jgi:hypothetical protein